jgi:hypothetical protein
VINMIKKKFAESISRNLTMMSFIVVMALFLSSLAGFTGAWFASESEVEPNIFVVEIPEVDTESAWSDGEAGFHYSYFKYSKDNPEFVRVYFIQNPNKRFKIGDIVVSNNVDNLFMTLDTTPRPDDDPPLPGGKMITSKHHITLFPNTAGHDNFSPEYFHHEGEWYTYTYIIPMSEVTFDDNDETYISIKIDFIKED